MKTVAVACGWLLMAAVVSAAPRDYYNTKAVLRGQVDVTDEVTYGRHMTLGGILETLLGERPSKTLDRWLSDNGGAVSAKRAARGEELPVPKPLGTSMEGQIRMPQK